MIDNQGKLTGTVFGKDIQGIFDSSTRKISFLYQANPPQLNVENYDGYASVIPGPDPVKQHFLAGIYGLVERQNRYGWYATREGIIPL